MADPVTPSRATLYPIERALVNTAVATIAYQSHDARLLLIWRLSRVLAQIPGEPIGSVMTPGEAAQMQEANDIRFGPLARVEVAAAQLVRLYGKDAARSLGQVNAAIASLRDALALYFIDRSDIACEAIGIPLDVPPAVVTRMTDISGAMTA